MTIWAIRRGERVEIHYSTWRQLYNIVRHARKWAVTLERAKHVSSHRSRKRILRKDHAK